MENQTTGPIMSTKDWVVTLLISYIPVVGFVMLFVWAFGAGENPNKANWAKGMLIWMVIGLFLFAFLWITVLAAIFAAYTNGSMDYVSSL